MYMYVHVCWLHGKSDLNIMDSFPLPFQEVNFVLQILHTRIHLLSIILKVHVCHSSDFRQFRSDQFISELSIIVAAYEQI